MRSIGCLICAEGRTGCNMPQSREILSHKVNNAITTPFAFGAPSRSLSRLARPIPILLGPSKSVFTHLDPSALENYQQSSPTHICHWRRPLIQTITDSLSQKWQRKRKFSRSVPASASHIRRPFPTGTDMSSCQYPTLLSMSFNHTAACLDGSHRTCTTLVMTNLTM